MTLGDVCPRLQNNHHNTHPQPHAQEGDRVPEANSENNPFNGLLCEAQGGCDSRKHHRGPGGHSLLSHEDGNHRRLGARPQHEGDEILHELGRVVRIVVEDNNLAYLPNQAGGDGAEAPAKPHPTAPCILEEWGPCPHSINKSNSGLAR